MAYDESFTIFGDAEPEDAWHPDDPVPEQLTNLVRRAQLLERRRLDLTGEPAEVLDALAEIVARARRQRLGGRERVRADQLDEDITHVRGRL